MTSAAHGAQTEAEAAALLRQAFPWRAVVEGGAGGPFVALALTVEPGSGRDDTVEIRLVGDPGEAIGRCALGALHEAVASGRLAWGGRLARQPEVPDAALLAQPFATLIGWQSRSDEAWVARMRLHQSWYRTFRLRLPFGTGPWEHSTTCFGSMLTGEPAALGRNFLSEDAIRCYQTRVEDGRLGVDEWRTSRNLLASQPMAFSVFGPLVENKDLATAVLRQIVPDVAQVTGGEVERPSNALGDATAFDVHFIYRRHDGTDAAIAIETKLSEPFSRKAYDWGHYLGHSAFNDTVWKSADPEALGALEWSQLWRNHLLARAEAARDGLGEPVVLVVHHPRDDACGRSVAGYRELLVDRSSCRAVDLGAIVDAIDVAFGSSAPPWVEALRDRYLRLDLSAGLLTLGGFRYESDARRAGVV